MIYTKYKVRLIQRNLNVCYTCYKSRYIREEAEMMEVGPVECSARLASPEGSETFKPYEASTEWHRVSKMPPFGIMKSEAIDRKINRFTVIKAGDGNIKYSEAIFDENCVDMSKEIIVRNFRITIISGGLKDHLSVVFLPKLDTNIHTSKPPEQAPAGGVVFHFKKQVASWLQNGVIVSQLLPLVGTNDKLRFVITSFKRVS